MGSGDPYVSPAVRQILANPMEGEQIQLRITLPEDSDLSQNREVLDTIQSAGGSLDAELPYSTYLVSMPEPAVAVLCDHSGLEAIETAAVVSMDGDAGEDVGVLPEDGSPD